jgi:hypothetical protein
MLGLLPKRWTSCALLDDPRTPGRSQQWHPREGREVEAVQLAAKVDFAAGPAALAFNDSGVFVSWKPPGTF